MDIILHTIWTISRSIILIALATYGGMAAIMYFRQSSFVYYPVHGISATPADIELSYDDIVFQAEDGVKLTGWYIPSVQPGKVLLFCHGNGGNISDRLDTIEIVHRLGLSMFIFDYRGYGKSENKPDEKGTYRDAEAAWRWLVNERGVSPDDIIIMGRSLGGAIAAWLAVKYPPKACIIESAFTSARDMGAEMYPWLPVRFVSRFRYTTIDYLKELICPVLIVHSPDDDIIPYHHGKRLFEAAHAPKEFLEIAGSHNDGFLVTGKRYTDGLGRFISLYVGEK